MTILLQKVLDYVLGTGVSQKEHGQRLGLTQRSGNQKINRNADDPGMEKVHVAWGDRSSTKTSPAKALGRFSR
jgi:hypothetical protein